MSVPVQRKGAHGAPPSRKRLGWLPFLRRLLLRAFLGHLFIPPFTLRSGVGESSRSIPSALCRLARWPRHRRSLAPRAYSRRSLRAGAQSDVGKKMGCSIQHPISLQEELALLRGLLLRALGSLLRHCFLLRISDSASDGPHGRHNWWAEPSTLIPDVDYG
jgi:hypothetical protein